MIRKDKPEAWKENKASGRHEFMAFYYKTFASQLVKMLRKTISEIWEKKTTLDSWEEANIVVIPKERKYMSNVSSY